jgi:hypothetical protein
LAAASTRTSSGSVGVRIHGRWRTGTAHLLPDDDPAARLRGLYSSVVRVMGGELLTIRVDVD